MQSKYLVAKVPQYWQNFGPKPVAHTCANVVKGYTMWPKNLNVFKSYMRMKSMMMSESKTWDKMKINDEIKTSLL